MQDFGPLELTLEKAMDLMADYLRENSEQETPVVIYKSAQELKKTLNLGLHEIGLGEKGVLEEAATFLKYSVRTGHKRFMNQLFSAVTGPAFLGEILATITNTTMSTFEVSPVGTLIEQALIAKMNSLVGFEHGEGIFVTGGSNANLVAMLCARNKLAPDSKDKGLYQAPRLLIFVSEDSHYSYGKAANCLGLGTNQIINVPTDHLGRMIPEKLEELILKGIAEGGRPFFLGATAGTTVTGAFDPLLKIEKLARKYGLWFHIDGSFGGALLLSSNQEVRNLMQGSQLADSFAWDAHKVMGIPLICSVVLMKKKGDLFLGMGGGGHDYLFHEYENESYDLGTVSLQCGRRMDALKLWLTWKCLGDNGYAERVDKLLHLSQIAEDIVKNHPKLELIIPRGSLNVCFQYKHPTMEEGASDEFNQRLRQVLVREGKYMVNYSTWKGRKVIRAVFLNPELSTQDVSSFFEYVVRKGDELLFH